ncbi:tetratricopeptide repeat protein [bacterium]|nr:tetratricopeptide repeat protein [bacterium]
MRGMMRGCMVGLLVALATTAYAQGVDVSDGREPQVTEEEAGILEQVSGLSRKNPGLAKTLLDKSMQKESSPALDFALGNVLFQMGETGDAEKAYRTALRKMPQFDRARANLTRVLLQQDKITAAREQLSQILLTGRNQASIMTLTGYVYLLDDKPVAAESAYRQALLSAPDDINAYLGLAKVLLIQERFHEAARLLETILQDYPRRGELWANLANARLALEQYGRAVVALETARRLGVASPEALATLGDLYLNRAQYTDAVQAYSLAFASEAPSSTRLLRTIGGLLQVKEVREAGMLIEKARGLEKNGQLTSRQMNQLQWLVARRFQLSGHGEAARRAYQKLIARDPLNGKAILALGDLYAESRSLDRALALYARASRISQVRVEALTKQARIEVERENYADAIGLLLDVQAVAPRETIARYIEQLRYLRR